jgi:hypothetical protein
MLSKYKEPQAHHWIVLRLVKQSVKTHQGHSRTTGLSTTWLIREVGIEQLMDMILQLEQEEANNVR